MTSARSPIMNSNKISPLMRRRTRRRDRTKHWDKNKRKAESFKVLTNILLLAGGMDLSIFSKLLNAELILNIGGVAYHHINHDNGPYSKGIRFIGVDKFLSAAVEFCHDVAREGRLPIVSVGSGDGSIEKKISEAYRKRYGKHSSSLDIILVDPDPRYKVHYKYVDELIEKRPNIVGHCAVFIFWPEQTEAGRIVEAPYDLEAVRSLQPHGVLTVYERFGSSGSEDFVKFLGGDLVLPWEKMGSWNHQNELYKIDEECDSYGLDNYDVYELAQHTVYVGPNSGTFIYRMVIARRVDFYVVNACPAINWTCRRQNLAFRKFVATNAGLKPTKSAKLAHLKVLFNVPIV